MMIIAHSTTVPSDSEEASPAWTSCVRALLDDVILPQSAEVTELPPADHPSEADGSDTSSESSAGGYDHTRIHSPPPRAELPQEWPEPAGQLTPSLVLFTKSEA